MNALCRQQPNPLFILVLACVALLPSGAAALPFIVNDDIRGVWNNRIAVGAAIRARDADKQLVGFNNAPEYPGAKGAVAVNDDGNLNFGKGDVISAPIVYTTDLELRYRNRYGVYGKLRTWYDYVGEHDNVPHGSISNGYRPNQQLDDSDYYNYNKFSGYYLLDAYAYGNWDIGESRITGRFGRQTINWGESLLYTGINAFNPLNLSALGRPSVRQDDALVPVNRLYSNLITRNGISIEAFYALDWEESHLPACGTLAQIVDILGDPACFAATAGVPLTDREQFQFAPVAGNPLLTPVPRKDRPDNTGQWGLSTRYFVEALDTEFGLYYTRYHATLPVLDIQLCDNGWSGCSSQDGLSLPIRYQENVKAFAISAATGVRNVALTAELSQFRDLPAQRNFAELVAGATGNRGIYAQRMADAGDGSRFSGSWNADRTQLLLGGVMDLTSAIGLADATLAAEVAGQWISNLPGTDEERIGRSGLFGVAPSANSGCDELTGNTEGGCKVDGYATDYSWGYRLLASISLPRPARGVDLLPFLSWSHDVRGYAIDGSLHEGRQIFAVRLRAIYQRAYFMEIGRTWIRSNTDYDVLRDKDAYAVSVGIAF